MAKYCALSCEPNFVFNNMQIMSFDNKVNNGLLFGEKNGE